MRGPDEQSSDMQVPLAGAALSGLGHVVLDNRHGLVAIRASRPQPAPPRAPPRWRFPTPRAVRL